MKNTLNNALAMIALLSVAGFTFLAGTWNIAPNYTIHFKGGRAEGTFSGLKGSLLYDPADLTHAKMDVMVDANTIKTGNETKDHHAKGSSWFDTSTYPTIRFTSSSFAKAGDKIVATGTLELHGVKKEVQIPFAYQEAGAGATFMGQFTVNRKDYGINGNMFGFSVGNDFVIDLRVPVTKP